MQIGGGAVLRRVVGALVCTFLCVVLPTRPIESRQWQEQASNPGVSLKTVLDEAQALTAKIGNRGVQALATLETARLRERDDTAAAQELTRRVASILPDLPEANTFGDMMKDALNPLNLLSGVGMYSAYGPYLGNTLYNARIRERQLTRLIAYESRKADLTLNLFEQMGRTDPAGALATALKLGPLFRAIAFEAFLRVAPREAVGPAIEGVRQMMKGDNVDVAPLDLGLLAEAVQRYEPELAQTVLEEALRRVRKTNTPIEILEAVYASAVKVQPSFDFDPAAPSVGGEVRARRRLAFARAISETDTERALRLIAEVAHDSAETRQRRALVLRLVAEQELPHLAAEISALAIRLLDHPELNRRFFFLTPNADLTSNFQFAGDALIALGIVDQDLAHQRSMAFPPNRRFLSELMRVELALSWLQRHRARAFEMLEAMDNRFWQAVADGAWRVSSVPASGEPSVSTIARVKREWPREAVAVAAEDPAVAARTLSRFEEVARLLDDSIGRRVSGRMDDVVRFRAYWVDYCPFALVELATARQRLGRDDASRAFEEARKLAHGADSPAREWALVWNARAWAVAGSNQSLPARDEAVARISRIGDHKHLEDHLVALVRQLSHLSPGAALQTARRAKNDVRPFALLAIVEELRGSRVQ
jgi:hypothetical protein